MKGRIKIAMIRYEVEIESDDPEVQEYCQRMLEDNRESLEAAMGEAVCAQVKRILPGVKAETSGGDDEEDGD